MHRRALRLGLALGALFAVTTWSGTAAQSTTILFLVAQPVRFDGDSYVLPLSDPDAIAHARTLVDFGPKGLASIVVANIDAGADGVNRDHRAAGEPAWSWHVTGLVEFAEFTVEICDGTPTLVEDDVQGWLANTDSTICFWSYTVVEELGPLPVESITWGRIKADHAP